jgi:carbon storage regulator
MLVLLRKKDEQIIIGDDIIITVCETRDDRVQIGIEAPRRVRVDRMEVRKARERDKSQSCV